MKGEEAFQVENTKDTERSPHDICVLLLDSDETGLVNLSEMMRKCGYRVVATTSADDLPLIINNKDEKIELVVAEFRFIEKNKYELLEKIRSICDISVVVVGACVKDTTISECLCRGAIFCLEKPLMERDLKNLWQYKVRRQQDFRSQIDTNPPEKRKERADTDTGENTEKGHGCDLGDQKKPKLIHAVDSQNGAIPNIGEFHIPRKGSVKEKPELEEELEKRFTQPVTDCAAFEEYEFDERDFQPLASVGHHEVPLSPQESSNKSVVGQLQMQKPQRALDEEVIQDGISLADLEFDMQEGQGSTSDLYKKEKQELFDDIFTDLKLPTSSLLCLVSCIYEMFLPSLVFSFMLLPEYV